jgi:gamma-glutamylcyclotransferase (GGCT)/AIG2-like uncharacterized protein YtfP
MMNPVNTLFVYGSLRSDFSSSGHKYISDYFNLIGKAKVKGKLYALKDYPAAIPTKEDCFIIGELYSISNLDEFVFAMKQLDDYEGVNTEIGGKPLYNRELADIYINEKIVQSWIYWYNGDVDGNPFIASGDVMEYLRQIK